MNCLLPLLVLSLGAAQKSTRQTVEWHQGQILHMYIKKIIFLIKAFEMLYNYNMFKLYCE